MVSIAYRLVPDGRTLASGGVNGEMMLWYIGYITLPELTVGNGTASKSTLAPGERFTLSIEIQNHGGGQAAATTLRYYRSTDGTITTSDTEVGTDSVDAIDGYGTSAESIVFKAPTAVGTYYYGACVDSVSNEIDEANNCSDAVSITVVRDPTLQVSTASPLTEAVLNGSGVTLKLSDGVFVQSAATIKKAVTVSGITGVSVHAVTPTGDTQVFVLLDFDGTDFDADATLSFSVGASAIASYTGSRLTGSLSVKAIVETDPLFVYWLDRGTASIRAASADGSRVESLVTRGLKKVVRDLVIDASDGKMYWIDNGAKKIRRADLDGSNVEDLVTQGLEYPRAIAVASDKIYWADTGTDKIQRADLDGSNIEDLVTRGLRITTGLAIDTGGGKMYWTDDGTNKIQRADLDGSNVEDLVTAGLKFPLDIALDAAGGKMYWTDVSAGKIQRANLDGTSVQDIITGASGPHSIALDTANSKIYWTDWRDNKIQRANLDGSGVEDVVTSGVDKPSVIAIADPSDQPPVVTPPDDDDDEPVYADEDVNRDGSVDGQDIVFIAQRLGQTGQGDVNGDGTISILDILLVAGALADNTSAAPAALAQLPKGISAEMLEQWLTEAELAGVSSAEYLRGMVVLEQMLAALAPSETMLLANYPNPFNPETWIPYHLSNDADVRISIYDSQGVLVRWLDLGHQTAGYYTNRAKAAYWDGKNESGEQAASGVYFYRLFAGDYSATRKMLILK